MLRSFTGPGLAPNQAAGEHGSSSLHNRHAVGEAGASRPKRLLLAYFDESGDAGPVGKSPTKYFVLGCLLVQSSNWLKTLDSLIILRGNLRKRYGIPALPELKSSDGFLRGRGPFKKLTLNRQERCEIFRECLETLSDIECKVFSIAVDKSRSASKGWDDPRTPAWTFAFQRLQKAAEIQNTEVLVLPDEGHDPFIRKILRKGRRYHNIPGRYGQTIKAKMSRIIEDPRSVCSNESYLTQAADWLAFAAHRSQYIDPKGPITAGLWDSLGQNHLMEVTKLRGGPPGIVHY